MKTKTSFTWIGAGLSAVCLWMFVPCGLSEEVILEPSGTVLLFSGLAGRAKEHFVNTGDNGYFMPAHIPSGPYFQLVRFDVSRIPSKATIDSATLVLTVKSRTVIEQALVLEINQVALENKDWVAGKASQEVEIGSSCAAYKVLTRWEGLDSHDGQKWSSGGRFSVDDCEDKPVASYKIDEGYVSQTGAPFDCTNLVTSVQRWVGDSAAAKAGWALTLSIVTTRPTKSQWLQFHPSSNPDRGPKLHVTYHLPK